MTEDVWNTEDETLPTGWKSKNHEVAGLTFLSPAGLQFSSRLAGYQHIILEGFPAANISEMAEFLFYENWQTSPEIPKGWMFQADETGVKFLTTDGSVLDSAEKVVSFLDQSDQSSELEGFGVENESSGEAIIEETEDDENTEAETKNSQK